MGNFRGLFSVISILMFVAFSIKAHSATIDILENYNLFSVWAQRNYSYECDELDLEKKMSLEIPKVLFLGLQAIKDVNIELLVTRFNSTEKNNILFTCIDDEKIEGLGALFEPSAFYITRNSFKFSSTGQMIILPKSAIRQIFIQENNLDARSVERRTDKKSWLNSSSKNESLDSEYAVVHEYLHFLKFDNFSTGLHNDLGTQGSPLRFDDDVVYACADLSFPAWTLKDGKTLIKTGAVVNFNIKNACIICASAKDNGRGGVVIDDNKISAAIRNCSSY
ncbi:MAG: hypothetical protein ACXVCP_16335 [Bdellovibrio sp.]